MAEWSEKKSWWLDLLKFGITFTLGAIITVAVINRIEEGRAKEWSYTQINDQLRLTALEDFRKNSFKYKEAALDAYTDLYENYKGPTKTSSMIRYEQEALDDYLIAVEELLRRFEKVVPGLKDQINALNFANDQRHKIYDELKDKMKKDHKYGSEGPKEKRADFDKLRDRFAELRGNIINDVGAYVLTGPLK